MKRVRYFAVFVSLASFSAFALDYAVWSGASGSWQDNAIWSTSRGGVGGQQLVPIDGEDVYLRPKDAAAGVTNTLTLAADMTLAPAVVAWWCWQDGGSAGAYCFDGNGHTWRTPDFAENGPYGTANGSRFYIRPNAQGMYFSVEDSSKSPNNGFMRLVDPHFTVFDHGSSYGMDIDRGVYDFYEPNGILHGTTVSLTIGGSFSNVGTTFDFTLRGEETLVRAYQITPNLVAATNRFTLTDGATMETPSNGYFRAANNTTVAERYVTLSKGATLRNGTTTGWFGKSGTQNGKMHFAMTDATLESLSTFSFYGDGDYFVSNSTLRAYGPKSASDWTTFGRKGFIFGENAATYTQRWHFADCSLEGAGIAFGNNSLDGVGKSYASNVMERVHIVMENGCSWGTGHAYVTNLTTTMVNAGAYGCNIGPDSVVVFEDVDLSGRRLNVGNYSQQFTGTTPSRLYVQRGRTRADMLAMALNFTSYVHVRDGGTVEASFVRLTGSNSDQLNDQYRVNAQDATLYVEEGGTLVPGQLYGHNNAICRGGTKTAKVVGDGGVLRPLYALGAGKKFVQYLDVFEITDKGLTLDLDNRTLEWEQNVTDQTGKAGRFVVRGAGSLSVGNSTFSVSETAVEGGTVSFGSGAVVSGCLVPGPAATVQILSGATLSGDLVLTNGARIVIAAGATVNLTSLLVDDGILEIDPSVTINVSGEVSLNRLQLFYSATPTIDTAVNTLVLDGEASQGVIDGWIGAVSGTRFTDGTYVRFGSAYDSGSGKTTFQTVRKYEASPISAAGNKVWTGSGAWATAANWDPAGVPTNGNRAVFSSESAGAAVAVANGDETGAIEFDADQKYTLAGDTLRFTADQGAAQIDVKKGEHEIAAPVRLAQRVDMTVAADSSLTVSGAMTGGALTKTGKGALVLSGANDFKEGVALSGGRNTVAGSGSVASYGGAAVDIVRLGNDTFELDASASQAFCSALSFEGESNDFPVLIKNEGDMTAKVAGSTGGSFLKHGAGELTLDFGATSMSWPSGKGGVVKNMTPQQASPLLTVPANGVIDGSMTNYLWSYTVASGALRLKGDSQATHVTAPSGTCGYFVGSEFEDWTATPELIVDGLFFQSDAGLQFGYNAGVGKRCKYGRILVENGGCFRVGTITVGNGCWSGDTRPELTVAVTNAAIVNVSATRLALPRKASNGTAVWRCKDAELCFRHPAVEGHIDAVFDHCAMTQWYSPDAYWSSSEFAYGTVEFCNGTVVYAREYRLNWDNKAQPYTTDGLTFVWDDARLAHNYFAVKATGSLAPEFWDESKGSNPQSVVIDSTCCNASLFTMEFKGKGMTVATPSGYSLTLGVPLVGAGGITQYGAGNTVIKDGAWRFTGLMDLAGGGTLDVSQHGMAIDNAFIGGSGTVNGGTFNRLKIACAVTDGVKTGGTPTFSNATFTGKMTVDLGHGADDPIAPRLAAPLALFRISGTTVAPKGPVKVVGVDGNRYAGDISVVDGVVYLTSVYKSGLAIIVK